MGPAFLLQLVAQFDHLLVQPVGFGWQSVYQVRMGERRLECLLNTVVVSHLHRLVCKPKVTGLGLDRLNPWP